MLDHLSGIQTFVQVAEARSFVAAARLSGLSSSAVGKAIVRLEDRLGVRLLNRSTRSVSLTQEGAAFLERCRRIMAELEAAELELSRVSELPRGRLRIGLPPLISLVLPILADFMEQYPEIELDLDFSDRHVDIIDEGFDAVIRTGELADSRLSARTVGSYHYKVVASPAYLERHGSPRSALDLQNHRCLHYRFSHTGKIEAWPLATGHGDLHLPISMVCNNVEARIEFALRGIGIAFLPHFVVTRHIAEGRLVHLLQDEVQNHGTIHVVWPKGRYPMPRVRALIDFLSLRLKLD